ncbi:hypothetical protein LXL04_036445 [Taraxacum kok-saghyz]
MLERDLISNFVELSTDHRELLDLQCICHLKLNIWISIRVHSALADIPTKSTSDSLARTKARCGGVVMASFSEGVGEPEGDTTPDKDDNLAKNTTNVYNELSKALVEDEDWAKPTRAPSRTVDVRCEVRGVREVARCRRTPHRSQGS